MNLYGTIRWQTVQKYLDKYPSAPSKTISRIIYQAEPALFRDIEDVRLIVRKYRGRAGHKWREKIKTRKYFTCEVQSTPVV